MQPPLCDIVPSIGTELPRVRRKKRETWEWWEYVLQAFDRTMRISRKKFAWRSSVAPGCCVDRDTKDTPGVRGRGTTHSRIRRTLYLARFRGTPFTLASPTVILIHADAYYAQFFPMPRPVGNRPRPRCCRRRCCLSVTANTVTSRRSSNLFIRTRAISRTRDLVRLKWNRFRDAAILDLREMSLVYLWEKNAYKILF